MHNVTWYLYPYHDIENILIACTRNEIWFCGCGGCLVLCHCNNLLCLILSANRLWWCTNSHSWLDNDLCITDVRSTCEAFLGRLTFVYFGQVHSDCTPSRPPGKYLHVSLVQTGWVSGGAVWQPQLLVPWPLLWHSVTPPWLLFVGCNPGATW